MIPIFHLNCNRRPLDEAGFALITAIIMLVIITALTGTAITVAVQSSTSTARDNNVKAELAAAEAGLQVASYRLTQLKPTETQCINESAAVTSTLAEVESKCKDSAESLGNGAKFQYWTTLPLTAGSKCAGRTIEAIAGVSQRCVSSEGKVNGALPGIRLQVNVKSSAGGALFGVKGFVGLEEITASGSVKIPGVVASNGKIIGEGGAAFERGFELCPEKPGTFTPSLAERKKWGGSIGEKGAKEEPSLEKTRKAGAPECPITAPLPMTHATEASNEDSRIGTTDKLEGTFTWSEPTHELTLAANAKLKLGGSKYYLCNFKATNNSTLIIEKGAKVELFIDSPADAAGKCKAETGKWEGSGAFKVENLAKNPTALLIIMYGKGPFLLANGGALEASIYAPEAEVTLKGGSGFTGGIMGNKVHLENGTGIIAWNEEVGSLTNGNPTGYARKGWAQCAPGTGGSETC